MPKDDNMLLRRSVHKSIFVLFVTQLLLVQQTYIHRHIYLTIGFEIIFYIICEINVFILELHNKFLRLFTGTYAYVEK